MPASAAIDRPIRARRIHLNDSDPGTPAFNTPETIPCYDPAARIVYPAGIKTVSLVGVSGKARGFAHKLLQTNNNELLHRSRLWQTRLKGH